MPSGWSRDSGPSRCNRRKICCKYNRGAAFRAVVHELPSTEYHVAMEVRIWHCDVRKGNGLRDSDIPYPTRTIKRKSTRFRLFARFNNNPCFDPFNVLSHAETLEAVHTMVGKMLPSAILPSVPCQILLKALVRAQ